MESPKVGIVILALVAAASLAGGLAGWKIRQQHSLTEAASASPGPSKSSMADKDRDH